MKKRVHALLISFVIVSCGPPAYFCDVLYAADDEIDFLDNLSLHFGEYEQMKEISIDPYAALRDGFYQHRKQR
ncbi:hypothetical protein VU12_07370 [Desulfobulbus sp. US4]|nr:hypothetical protein [Desulfobulbus sp. US4]